MKTMSALLMCLCLADMALAEPPEAADVTEKAAEDVAAVTSQKAFARIRDDQFFRLKDVPERARASVDSGDDIEINLEEDITSGFQWTAEYDRSLVCEVKLDHKGPRRNPLGLGGTPGHAEIEIEPFRPGEYTIRLVYSRPWEKDTPPSKTMELVLEAR